jgi:hypothetical protein
MKYGMLRNHNAHAERRVGLWYSFRIPRDEMTHPYQRCIWAKCVPLLRVVYGSEGCSNFQKPYTFYVHTSSNLSL